VDQDVGSSTAPAHPVYKYAHGTWTNQAEAQPEETARCRCVNEDATTGLSMCNNGCGNPNQVCSTNFGCPNDERKCNNNRCTCMPNMALDVGTMDVNNMMSFDDCMTQCAALDMRIPGSSDQFDAVWNTGCNTNSQNQWIDPDGMSGQDKARYDHAAQSGHTQCPTHEYSVHTLQDKCHWTDAEPYVVTPPNAKDNAGWFKAMGWTQVARSAPPNFGGQNFGEGTHPLQFTFDDVFGNVLTCDTMVNVTDTQAPIITTCPMSQSIDTEDKKCAAVATWPDPTSSDNCGDVDMTQSHQSGHSFAHGPTDVSYFASDGSPFSPDSWCNFSITVVDNEDPLISCTAAQSQYLPEAKTGCHNGMTIDLGCGATDNCQQPADLSVNCKSQCTAGCCIANQGQLRQLPSLSSSSFDVGTHLLTCETEDASGNTGDTTQIITVLDTELPVLGGCVTQPVVINASELTGTCEYDYDDVTASDNSCNVTHGRVNPKIGIPLIPGIYEVLYEASDCSGNEAECKWNVTCADVHAPEWINCPVEGVTVDAVMGQPWGIAHWAVPNATDNCVQHFGPGCLNISHAPYVQPGLAFPVGVTGMEMMVIDTAGNEAICEFDVVVRDIQIPILGVPDGAGKQCGGPRVQTVAFDDPTKVNTVSYQGTYEAVCPNGYSCQHLVGSLIDTCQPAPTCIDSGLVTNGNFDQGGFSPPTAWECYHKADDEVIGDCHLNTDYEGEAITGHLSSQCYAGTSGGFEQTTTMPAGEYKLKFNAYAGTQDNQGVPDTDYMQVSVTNSVNNTGWTTLAVDPGSWQPMELKFAVATAGIVKIRLWSGPGACIDVVNIVVERCDPTDDPNAPPSVAHAYAGSNSRMFAYGSGRSGQARGVVYGSGSGAVTFGTGSGAGSAEELWQDIDAEMILED
jgi:hypothetical protein